MSAREAILQRIREQKTPGEAPLPELDFEPTAFADLEKQLGVAVEGKLITLATEMDRTLFFDFLPLELGTVKGFKTRFHLYTVPGQVYYDASRKLILRGVDGVVFVADSQQARYDANIESLYNLHENLEEYKLNLADVPFVLQYNKRDMDNVIEIDELEQELNPEKFPSFPAVAVKGDGVFDTLKCVAKGVLKKLSNN
jgi:signal recognition particle receptor subunit beta